MHAKQYLENLTPKLAELHRRSAQAGSAEDLAAAQSVLTATSKEMNKAAVKDWKEWVRHFNTIAGQSKRAAGRQNAARRTREAEATRVKPALYTFLRICELPTHNMANSVCETRVA